MRVALKVIITFFFLSMLVLVLTHATGFAAATTAVGGQVNQFANFLSGTDMNKLAQQGKGGTSFSPITGLGPTPSQGAITV